MYSFHRKGGTVQKMSLKGKLWDSVMSKSGHDRVLNLGEVRYKLITSLK